MTYKKLYRVYYTTYSDELHDKVKKTLASKLGVEIIDYPSRVNPEFRFLEVLLSEPGRGDEIAEVVNTILGCKQAKVDWIDTEVG
ncbi:MAG: hypothetical protein QXS85_00800 [Acidilobaceae archaeon]